MPFLRFTRDKRGYEHFQLVQPTTNRRGQTKTRVLYWFRSPPNVRVGREPFDQHVRAALEQQNPDLEFDWDQILATPIPSGDAERWRDRRRQERAARQAAADEDEPSNDSSERDRRNDQSLDVAREKHRTAGAVIEATPEELTAESSRSESAEESKPELKDDDL